MNPSSTKLMSPDAVQDQSPSQGLSKALKKQTKGKNILDGIGSVGSFASILEKTGAIVTNEKKGYEKEGSVNHKGKLVGVNNKAENALLKMNEGETTGTECVARRRDLPLGGIGTQSAEAVSSKSVSAEGSEQKLLLGKGEHSPVVENEKFLHRGNVPDLAKALHGQNNSSAQKESVLDMETTAPFVKDIPALSDLKKSVTKDLISRRDESQADVKEAKQSGARENILSNKNIPEEIKLVRVGDESIDRNAVSSTDQSQGVEIKGVAHHKISPDTKEHGVLSERNSLHPDGVKENAVQIDKVYHTDEKIQEGKNLFTHGRPVEKPVEGSIHENTVAKTESSLWTVQAELSSAKSVGNYGLSSTMNADMNTSVQFQNILDQIEDTAAQMVKKGPGRIVLTLEPPNLGALNVDVKVHNDMVRLVLVADNHEVKQVLQTNLDQLKTALQDQGLTMDRFDVLVQQRSSENPGFHQWSGALFGEGQGRRENTKGHSAPPQSLPVHGDDVNEPYMGMISLFA